VNADRASNSGSTHNSDPMRYVWTATAESLLATVARGRITPEKIS